MLATRTGLVATDSRDASWFSTNKQLRQQQHQRGNTGNIGFNRRFGSSRSGSSSTALPLHSNSFGALTDDADLKKYTFSVVRKLSGGGTTDDTKLPPLKRELISWTRIEPTHDPVHGCPIERSSHGVSICNDGTKLLVLGGEHIARTPIDGSIAYWAADLVDNDSNKWQWRLITSVERPSDRIAHEQAVYNDSIVYIFGGRSGIGMDEEPLNDLWKLDCSGPPGTERWSKVEVLGGTPPTPRSFHRMICIGDSLYVFGGCSSNGREKDLYKFDLLTRTWYDLGPSPLLRGRGGPTMIPIDGGTKIGIISGFAGEETSDGHVFDIQTGKWDESLIDNAAMRPRSVCVGGSFPTIGYSIIFGGEVDPSDRGHEGAGGFANDIVVLDESSGAVLNTLANDDGDDNKDDPSWPTTRGWSDSATMRQQHGGKLYFFGGLTGNDESPQRLDDLWVLTIHKT